MFTCPPSVQCAAVSTSRELICRNYNYEGADDYDDRYGDDIDYDDDKDNNDDDDDSLTKVPPQKGREERLLLRSPTYVT